MNISSVRWKVRFRSKQAEIAPEVGRYERLRLELEVMWNSELVTPGALRLCIVLVWDAGCEAHLNGDIAKALMAKADQLFSEPPRIHKIAIIAEK